MKTYDKCYIDGQWIQAKGTTEFTLVDPATEAPFATVRLGNADDVDYAVHAARRAFPTFSGSPKEERVALLERIVGLLVAREPEIEDAVTQELGSPRGVKMHTVAAIASFRQAIATLKAYDFETHVDGNIVRREPIGVCGLITAWNWPVQLLATKVSMALAAGCTVILKPSEFTPVSAILFTQVLHDAGVPKGVFNLVLGDGPTVGNAIAKHPDIDMVSFTGSTRAGILVAEAAAPTVKRVSQELGGKSANIILPDADLRAAAQWNIARAFGNSGQSCHAPTRVLVHESQVEEVVRILREEAGKVRVGDPKDVATKMGPVVNNAQFERVEKYIQLGLDEGARLVCGGLGRPEGLPRGYYVKPTVFADVKPGMTIAQEEIFGPVLVVLTYRTEAEAIEIANGTQYGLGAYIFTTNRDHGHAVGAQMRAGRVFLNGMPSNPAAPMGGYKRSGNGREMGLFGLEEYLEVKAMIGFEAPVAA